MSEELKKNCCEVAEGKEAKENCCGTMQDNDDLECCCDIFSYERPTKEDMNKTKRKSCC